MFDYALVEAHGRVVADPESKGEGAKKRVAFSIAANVGKDQTIFFNVTAFGGLSDFALDLKKGDRVSVSGVFGTFTGSDGKVSLSITAEHIYPGTYRSKTKKETEEYV